MRWKTVARSQRWLPGIRGDISSSPPLARRAEDLLAIPEQDRAGQTETDTETETETTEEAAHLAWIESTTTAGMQLDLIQYLGYDDATWQDVAAPAA